MIDFYTFLKLIDKSDTVGIVGKGKKQIIFDNHEIDETGIKLVPSTTKANDVLTDYHLKTLKFPCSPCEFSSWAKASGLEDYIGWSLVNSEYEILKKIVKIKTDLLDPHQNQYLDESISDKYQPTSDEFDALSIRLKPTARMKMTEYEIKDVADVIYIEGQKESLRREIQKIDEAIKNISTMSGQNNLIPNVNQTSESQKRINALHELIARVDSHLNIKFDRRPSAREVWIEIKNNHAQYDAEDIIQEVTEKQISWYSPYGNESSLKRKSFDKTLSNIRNKK